MGLKYSSALQEKSWSFISSWLNEEGQKTKIAPSYPQLSSLLVFLRYLSVPNLKLFQMLRADSPQKISADALTKAFEF